MRKAKSNFNAIEAFREIADELENSSYRILGQYNPALKSAHKRKKHASSFKPALEEETENDLLTDSFKENVEQLGKLLKLTPMQIFLFVASYATFLVNRRSYIDERDLLNFFNIDGLDFLPLQNDFKTLINNGLLRVHSRRHNEYFITQAAEQCILESKSFKIQKAKLIDQYKFCKNISDLIQRRDDEEIDTEMLFSLTVDEENTYGKLTLVKEVKKILTDIAERVFFYEMCDDFIHHGETGLDCTLSDIYDDVRDKMYVAKTIMKKTNPLITLELMEVLPAPYFTNANVRLTEKGKHLFLGDDFELFEGKGGHDKRLVAADKIPERQLFFADDLSKELDFLKESLLEDKFVSLQKRLKERNLPTGINVLLYGAPGTGKTASAEMIAKATGRSVYHVDIAASKSCWFGESEKLFKRIFDDYRRMCKNEELKPILLFNEADALFSKRKEIGSSSVDQTENALQNILLEEMEKLDGILIATTNLSDNLDAAFDRRFLFKIRYGQPDKAAKKAIWQSKLEWLSDDDSSKLAANFDLSGGEIDNIVRKSEMEQLLHDTRPDLTMLEDWCRQEKLGKGKGKSIGFAS